MVKDDFNRHFSVVHNIEQRDNQVEVLRANIDNIHVDKNNICKLLKLDIEIELDKTIYPMSILSESMTILI